MIAELCQWTVKQTTSFRRCSIPRGSKAKYTNKQERQAEHIEEGYRERGVGEAEAERRAWATVNKMTGGGKKSGSGRGHKVNTVPARTGCRKGGAASASRPPAARSASAKKAARPRARRGTQGNGRKAASRSGGAASHSSRSSARSTKSAARSSSSSSASRRSSSSR
jgi:plasmid stabilization system protein ParE